MEVAHKNTKYIQVIGIDFADIALKIDSLRDTPPYNMISLMDEKGNQVIEVRFIDLKEAVELNRLLSILKSKDYGVISDKQGSRLISQNDYFENLHIEQCRRITHRLHAAIEKFMTDNELRLPEQIYVSKKIYETLKLEVLKTPLYEIPLALNEEMEDNGFMLAGMRHNIQAHE